MFGPQAYGFGFAYFLFGGIHFLGAIAVGMGLFMLLLWAVRKLSERDLLRWGSILFVGGAVVCLLTLAALGMSSSRFGRGWGPGWMMGGSVDGSGSVEASDDDGSGAFLPGMMRWGRQK